MIKIAKVKQLKLYPASVKKPLSITPPVMVQLADDLLIEIKVTKNPNIIEKI